MQTIKIIIIMRKFILLSVMFLCSVSLFAQYGDKNPFAQHGYKKKNVYTSSKGEFNEFHDKDSIVEICSALFNVKTGKIVRFLAPDELDKYVPASEPAISVDPLAEKYYWITPYAYCNNNPIMFYDPDGRDPIYAKVKGQVRTIGDDGKEGTGSYLVRGAVARAVRAATAVGECYTGNLSQSKNVMHIPTGQTLRGVNSTAIATAVSGTSPDTRVENGGHSIFGFTKIWDAGSPVRTGTDADGNTTKTWSITPFKIGGKYNQVGIWFSYSAEQIGGKSDIEHIWHIHPNGSDPSPQDFKTLSGWRREGYTGIPFLIDTENNRVTFYNEKGNIIKVKYEDFIRMGHQDIIK